MNGTKKIFTLSILLGTLVACFLSLITKNDVVKERSASPDREINAVSEENRSELSDSLLSDSLESPPSSEVAERVLEQTNRQLQDLEEDQAQDSELDAARLEQLQELASDLQVLNRSSLSTSREAELLEAERKLLELAEREYSRVPDATPGILGITPNSVTIDPAEALGESPPTVSRAAQEASIKQYLEQLEFGDFFHNVPEEMQADVE